jgi:hypothetical protein
MTASLARSNSQPALYPFIKTDGGRSLSKRPKRNNKWDEDCTVRAVAVACGITYDEAIDALNPDGDGTSLVWGKFQFDHMMANSVINGWRFEWIPFPAVRGQPRMNPPTFSERFPVGRFICKEAGHVVAWVDGQSQRDRAPQAGQVRPAFAPPVRSVRKSGRQPSH